MELKKEGFDKKEAICNASIKAFSRDGFYEATIDKIAAAADVAVGTIYNYFESKNDILNYIYQREYEKRRRFFEKIRVKKINPLEKLRLIISMHFSEVKKNPEVFKIILREKHMPRLCYFEGITKFEGLPRFIEEIIDRGIQTKELCPCDPRVVSAAIFGAVEALMSRYILEFEKNGYSSLLDKATEQVIGIFEKGLRYRPPAFK